jgi:chromosome segregation ATPase
MGPENADTAMSTDTDAVVEQPGEVTEVETATVASPSDSVEESASTTPPTEVDNSVVDGVEEIPAQEELQSSLAPPLNGQKVASPSDSPPVEESASTTTPPEVNAGSNSDVDGVEEIPAQEEPQSSPEPPLNGQKPIEASSSTTTTITEKTPAAPCADPLRRIAALESELAQAQSLMQALQQAAPTSETNKDSSLLLTELQSNLQQQIMRRAEAEHKARRAEPQIHELNTQVQAQAEQLEQYSELQDAFTRQGNEKVEAENYARMALERMTLVEDECKEQKEKLDQLETTQTALELLQVEKEETEGTARLALERVEQLQTEHEKLAGEIGGLQNQVVQAREAHELQRQELLKIREERDEQRRKEMALTSRLNSAKMKEADKANLAEHYEDEVNAVERELKETKARLMDTKADKQRLEQELEQLQKSAKERIAYAESSLSEERRLNEERKRKMKAFVESKSEELRQAKDDNDSLQVEVGQTNRSLMELNGRWKQLHAQYVQSQTRNRELQRDLNRIKKDSENLHKVGDTLGMKLSRSATETEEHKNKRVAAKHELMTVLRALEAERDITAKLRDTIKFTFTPKALSQQQLLQESLEEFEAQLHKLSRRLGRPLPPSTVDAPPSDLSETSGEENGSSSNPDQHKASRSDADVNRLIAKLEHETQAVSQCIMALTGNVERMHMVLDASGERNCVSVLAEILSTGGAASSPAVTPQDGDDGGANRRRLRSSPSHRYGSLPSALH